MPADVSAPLPELVVRAGSTYTVTCDDPNALITQLVVHGAQTDDESAAPPEPAAVYLLQTAAEQVSVE